MSGPLQLIRRWAPRSWFRLYHRLLATVAAFVYGRPSRHLIVIGITGTDGKTTTASLLAETLTVAGKKVALSSSVYRSIAGKRWLNETHMTMPGRFALQRWLRDARRAGCQYAVIEVSSEGLLQHRHRGIDFDGAVITNLTPEHLKTHGSFEAYRNAKGRLFAQIIRSGDKHLPSQSVPKFSLVNLDDPSAEYFLKFWAEEHHGFTLEPSLDVKHRFEKKVTIWKGETVQLQPESSTFVVDGHALTLPLPGKYNVANALAAVATARILGIDWAPIIEGLQKFSGIPGRFEVIPLPNGAKAIIDYALTPAAVEQLYQTIQNGGAKRLITVFGAAGGGRDSWKRPELGAIAARFADQIILTTDDPYDESPAVIAEAIAAGIPADRRQIVQTILDRRGAIQAAIAMAQPGDVIAITGMGAETSMMVKGRQVPWNDATVVREGLR